VTALRISNERQELDVPMIHRYLAEESYWARGLSRAVLERALAHSLCFGGYLDREQVAFGRVVTDQATIGYLKDVFVLPTFQGRGYGKALVGAMVTHPDLRGVALMLGTEDAHGLYKTFGFVLHPAPERVMVRAGNFLQADPRADR
jgi:GNAT superfamily N-acetyltransferase